jgi:hypothetical protein
MLVQYVKRPVYHFVGILIHSRPERFGHAVFLLRVQMNRHDASRFSIVAILGIDMLDGPSWNWVPNPTVASIPGN